MRTIHERCGGLDVHRDQVTACVRVPGPDGSRAEHGAAFATTTNGLLSMLDWLAGYGVTHVAMEATGIVWRPVFYVLEGHVDAIVVNGAHMRNVPGRKTDTADAAWIAQPLEHGLLRASFIPPPPIRELRELTRYRKTQIAERQREANRLHKVLRDAGVKLSSVASDVLGVSGRTMVEALIADTTDPRGDGRPGPRPAKCARATTNPPASARRAGSPKAPRRWHLLDQGVDYNSDTASGQGGRRCGGVRSRRQPQAATGRITGQPSASELAAAPGGASVLAGAGRSTPPTSSGVSTLVSPG